MKRFLLTAAIIIGVVFIISAILAASCKTGTKSAEVQDIKYKEQYYAAKDSPNSIVPVLNVPDSTGPDLTSLDLNGFDLTGAVYYTVKSGDTLYDISKSFYGDGFYYPVIVFASHGVVKNPDLIMPGMELIIPNLERNKATANSRRSIKECLNWFVEIERRKVSPNQGLIDSFRKLAASL